MELARRRGGHNKGGAVIISIGGAVRMYIGGAVTIYVGLTTRLGGGVVTKYKNTTASSEARRLQCI